MIKTYLGMTKLEIFFFTFIIAISVIGFNILAGIMSAVEIESEYDITHTSITVNWFDTEQELIIEVQRLEDEYCEEFSEECPDGPDDYSDTSGLTECDWQPKENNSLCELWLVRPTELDEWTFDVEQDNWKTIGHEFYHTVAGGFHDE